MRTSTPGLSRPSTQLLALTLVGFLCAPSSFAQSFSVGTDLVSRYVWRGTDFGESASIQPSLAFEVEGFEIGAWASYSVSADGSDANEIDFWVAYTIEAGGAGSVTFGATDYYFPSPDGPEFFDFADDGEGSHTLEPFLAYTGPDSFPIEVLGAVNVHNDLDNSVYLEAGIPIHLHDVVLDLTAGAVANESGLYATDGFAFVNLGLSATKELSLSEQFAVPVSIAFILNPQEERSFLVLGVGISL